MYQSRRLPAGRCSKVEVVSGNTSEITRMCCDNGWSETHGGVTSTTIARSRASSRGIHAQGVRCSHGTSAMAYVPGWLLQLVLQSGTWGYARVRTASRVGAQGQVVVAILRITRMCCDNG